MPHIEYSTMLSSRASVYSWNSETRDRKDFIEGESYPGAEAKETELEIHVNNDNWNYSTPFEGVKLSLSASGLPAKEREEGEFQTCIRCRLIWDQIKHLHDFLGMLLANVDALKVSPEDLAAAAAYPEDT